MTVVSANRSQCRRLLKQRRGFSRCHTRSKTCCWSWVFSQWHLFYV